MTEETINFGKQHHFPHHDEITSKSQPNEIEQAEAKKRMMASSAYYNDSIASLAGKQTIDIKWEAAAPISAVKTKTPAPGSLSVEEAQRLLEESSPAFAKSMNVDTIIKSEKLEDRLNKLTKMIDDELKKPDRNFEKLQALVYLAVMGMMHKFKQVDQEYISESGLQIKLQAVKVQGTYNTWPAVAITIVSSVVSIAGGAAGLSPLAPLTWINADTARIFQGASQSIGTAGQGLGGIGSIFSSKGESTRFVYQIDLEEIKKKREDKEASKHQKSSRSNEARNNAHESSKLESEIRRTILSV